MSKNDNTTRPAEIRSCYCLALRQAARRVTQVYDRALAPAGLRGTQLPILVRLAEAGPTPMKALAAFMVMDRATLGHNIRPLEAQGLVALTVGADRRSRLVALTDTGRTRLETARRLWRDAQDQFETAFGADNAAALRTLLNQVSHADYQRLE